jgi:hypothetical protein
MMPGQVVLVHDALYAHQFIKATLVIFLSTAMVLVPLIYAHIQMKKQPRRWKPRFLTKVIWGFVIANIIFDCVIFFNFALGGRPLYWREIHIDPHPTRTQPQIWEIEKAVQIYSMQHNGKFPNSIEDLVTGTEDHPGLLKKGNIIDNWGTPYGYSRFGKKIRISSAGPDRKVGTQDDITN